MPFLTTLWTHAVQRATQTQSLTIDSHGDDFALRTAADSARRLLVTESVRVSRLTKLGRRPSAARASRSFDGSELTRRWPFLPPAPAPDIHTRSRCCASSAVSASSGWSTASAGVLPIASRKSGGAASSSGCGGGR